MTEPYRKIVSMLANGSYVTDVARELNVPVPTVSGIRRREGLPTRRKGRYTPDPKLDRAADLLNDGASFAEVARTLSMSTTTLRKYFPGMAWSEEQKAEHMSAVQRAIKAEKRSQKRGTLIGAR